MVYYRMFNKKKGEKMNEPTLKDKTKQLLEELKEKIFLINSRKFRTQNLF
jgi:hypothetical protein